MERITVKVTDGEFRVPGPDGTEAQAYYTDDKQDAIDTARAIYGPHTIIVFKRTED